MADSRFGAINIKENMNIRGLSSAKNKGRITQKIFKNNNEGKMGYVGRIQEPIVKRVPNLQSWNNLSKNIR